MTISKVIRSFKMAVAVTMFRWLDLLEKEFDKAFVDLDLLLGEIDPDQSELTYQGRQKLTSLSSSFAQLTHKAQTVFQTNAKLEVKRAILARTSEISHEKMVDIVLGLESFLIVVIFCSLSLINFAFFNENNISFVILKCYCH